MNPAPILEAESGSIRCYPAIMTMRGRRRRHPKEDVIKEDGTEAHLLDRFRALARPIAILIVVAFIATTLVRIFSGQMLYRNYKGLPVFAPFALVIAIGLLFLILRVRDK